jgi:hypothetical protein
MNGYRQKTSNEELTEYQRRIESIDNVILCVAEAEKMFREVGMSLISESEIAEQLGELQKKTNHSFQSTSRSFYA